MTERFFHVVNRYARPIVFLVVATALVLGAVAPNIADSSEPNFDPDGQVFDDYARADALLRSESSIGGAAFLVESPDGGDVLTAAALRDWQAASSAVRSDANHAQHLVVEFDPNLGRETPGIISIADVVDSELPNGVANATDAEVKAALARVLSPDSPAADMRSSLSEQATLVDGVWTAPAFIATVTFDDDTFSEQNSELWLRDVQADFRESTTVVEPIGVAIDFDETFDEAIQASAPFIFLAVAFIVLLIAIVHRSYWSAIVVGTGLGVTMAAYNGVAALLGLKMGSLLLSFIVPIAMISFGVDFYVHGSGRVREMQVDHGMNRRDAYPAGMRAVFLALLLAATSSVAAFLSNVSSGTEAITEFGIGAAIALSLAYLILGLIAPRVLVGIEQTVGANPVKGRSKWAYGAAILPMAIVAGLATTMAAVMPSIGAGAVAGVIVLLVAVPVWATRRRNRTAAATGRPLTDAIKGSAHGLESAGTLVRGLAARNVITLPIVLLLGVAGLFTAFTVESGFELKDFLSSDTGVVQSLEKYEEHFPSSGEGSSMIFIEGDLTQPATLEAIDAAVAELDGSDVEMGRYPGGELIVNPTASDIVRTTMASPDAVAAIERRGTVLTDSDGNGLPDTAAQVAAVYDFVSENGVLTPDGEVAYAGDEVGNFLYHDGVTQATAITVQVGSFTDGRIIEPVWDALAAAGDGITASTDGLTTVAATGDVIAQYVSLESFADSMLVSLPIAIALTLLLASLMLRSFRYGIAAVVPIGFVVTGVYAFMALTDYTINVVTATIAAIAVGVGIDFSTHLTARYREELESTDDRLEALRIAGAGTGGALVLSAVTSVLGFTVMAFAPTPIFSTFGVLTAVMIALALVASLVVLPSVLLLVTPKRKKPSPPLRELPTDKEWVLAR